MSTFSPVNVPGPSRGGHGPAGAAPLVVAAAALVATAALVGLWRVMGAVLSSDRGLDSTDEALYLLAASPPSRTASWNVPWGWHTRPLYLLVGGDISRFRTAGAVILVITSASAGVLGSRAARALVGPDAPHLWHDVDRTHFAHRMTLDLGGALIGGVGAMMAYADLIRVPGYNWVNLVGATIALGGFAGLLNAQRRSVDTGSPGCGRPPSRPRSSQLPPLAWPVIVTVGLFVTLPAKPSTAPLLLVLFSLAAAVELGWRGGIRLAVRLFGLTVAMVVVAVLTGWWPRRPVRTLARTVGLPPLSDDQTIGGAVGAFVTLPNRLVESVSSLPFGVLVAVVAASAVAVVAGHPRLASVAPVLRLAALAAMVLTALHVALVPVPGLGSRRPVSRLFLPEVTTAGILVLVGGLLVALPGWPDIGAVTSLWARRDRRWARALLVPAVFAAGPFVVGFGSANRPYAVAGLAIGLLFVGAASLAALMAGRSPRVAISATGVIAVAVVALVAVTLVESREHPYRSSPISAMTDPVVIGAGRSRLFMASDVASDVGILRTAAADAGWTSGTPIIGLVWRWSAWEPLVLDAEVPDSLMLTLFGYDSSVAWVEENVANLAVDEVGAFDDADDAEGRTGWADAWVLVRDPAQLPVDQQATVDQTLEIVERRVGQSFPQNYDHVVTVDGVQLWRPAGRPG